MDEVAERLASKTVVCLPDYFVDRFVPIPDAAGFDRGVERLRGTGGGNLIVANQWSRIGGDAVNVAFALASLGVRVRLWAQADPAAMALLRATVDGLPLDTQLVREVARGSATVALEFSHGGNVMLSDPGPLDDLSPADLADGDWSAIEAADAVVVANWSQIRGHGTGFVEAVIARARAADTRTYLDTSDPTHRAQADGCALVEGRLARDLDVWSMSANEAVWFAGAVGCQSQDAATAGAWLADRIDGRVDVHTAARVHSIDSSDRHSATVESFDAKAATGAGDAWLAGVVAADLLEMSAPQRLALANAVAGHLLRDPDHVPPRWSDVSDTLALAP